jgi:hypothetical protein
VTTPPQAAASSLLALTQCRASSPLPLLRGLCSGLVRASMSKRGNVQQCAWADCHKTTDDPRRFGVRRPIDALLVDVLLKALPHSAVLCNQHGQAWNRHVDQLSSSTVAVAPSPSAQRVDALVSAAAVAASPPRLSSSSPSSSSSSSFASHSASSFDCLLAADAINSQPLPSTHHPPAPSTAASPRRALSALSLNTSTRRRPYQRRHATPLKKKLEVVRAVSAAQTDAEREAVLSGYSAAADDLRRYTQAVTKNAQLPREQRRPLTAKRLLGAGKKRALDDNKEAELEQWVMSKRRCEARLSVSELDIKDGGAGSVQEQGQQQVGPGFHAAPSSVHPPGHHHQGGRHGGDPDC